MECSACGQDIPQGTEYCPFCGAEMDEAIEAFGDNEGSSNSNDDNENSNIGKILSLLIIIAVYATAGGICRNMFYDYEIKVYADATPFPSRDFDIGMSAPDFVPSASPVKLTPPKLALRQQILCGSLSGDVTLAVKEKFGSFENAEDVIQECFTYLENTRKKGKWKSPKDGIGIVPGMVVCALLKSDVRPGGKGSEKVLRDTIAFLMQNQTAKGRFTSAKSTSTKKRSSKKKKTPMEVRSTIWGATALAEASSVLGDLYLKKAATKSLDLVLNGQQSDGGWGYKIKGETSNILITAEVIECLAMIRDAGFKIPKKHFDNAETFARGLIDSSSFYPIAGMSEKGDVRTKDVGPRTTGAAAFILVLNGVGKDDADLSAMLKTLNNNTPKWDKSLYKFRQKSIKGFGGEGQSFTYWRQSIIIAQQLNVKKIRPYINEIIKDLSSNKGKRGGWKKFSPKEEEIGTPFKHACIILTMQAPYRFPY